MTRKFWWPTSMSDQVTVVTNLALKIAGYGTVLSLTPAQVTAIVNLCEAFIGSFNATEAAKTTCYINGFEADCEEAANHPDTYEEDPGDIGLATFSDGSRRFVLRNYGTGGWNTGPPTLRLNQRSKERRKADKIAGDRLAATGIFDNEGGGRGDLSIFFTHAKSGRVLFKGNDEARAALKEVMASGDCADTITKALANLRPMQQRTYGNSARSTDAVSLFDNLDNQTQGGITLNDDGATMVAAGRAATGSAVAGGGGLTWAMPKGNYWGSGAYMYVNVAAKSFDPSLYPGWSDASLSRGYQREIYHSILDLIHEITHGAGENITFQHNEMDAAAKIADSTASSFDDLIRRHCFPEGYR